jgi:NAD-dependent deacetylase sirtuin 2
LGGIELYYKNLSLFFHVGFVCLLTLIIHPSKVPSEFLDLLKRFSLMQSDAADKPKEKLPQILTSLTVDGVVEYIKSGRCRNIIVMNGAGISVAAGIPDFRSPQTGLYHNLQKYNLPYAEAIFEIGYFKQRPEAFYALAKELYPGHYKPTPCHWFCYLLHLKKILLRVYTQNIDTLERLTGLPEDKIVEAHGSFATAHCVDCDKEHSSDFVKECVLASKIPRCDQCNGLVKPDIVFFGEGLPPRFFQLMREDFPKCDLLIVMGTSLKVQPFASLINHVSPECPRVLINRDAVGLFDPLQALFGNEGFMFNRPDNYRDVAILGDCQECVKQLVEKLGWKEEFEKLTKTERTQ